MSLFRARHEPAALFVLRTMIHHRNVLVATTVFELKKRYAGSAFGLFWVILYPALLLGVYIFVYMVVFKVRFPDMGEYQYVL